VRVTFNALAEQELNDAARYYEVERAGLGGDVHHWRAALLRGHRYASTRGTSCAWWHSAALVPPVSVCRAVLLGRRRNPRSRRDAPSAPSGVLGRQAL